MKRFAIVLAALAAAALLPASSPAAVRHHAHARPVTRRHVPVLPFIGSTPFSETLLDQIQHNWKVRWDVDKVWVATGKPYGSAHADGNILLTAGITRMLNLLIAAGGQAYDNGHSRLGAGDGSTGVLIGDTDLSAVAGSTHRWFQVSDSSTPTVATNVVTFKATFASADGNFAWGEIGTDAGSASSNAVVAPLLNRKVTSLGTKVAGAAWTLTETITVS